ncbi:MAG: hypothetical protein R3209_07505 [Salinimicrobium sediminis]|uniref:Hemerythrin HHE cation binding domain-containing protein n=1 Tax=Salinimicrobium sediminis TaxID=1343891 RepID=A0A285X808_9FLAO|nr:hypothetical protein [Salinimicrobium sediminis]MDX1602902.1 hypothetical protein [Salinimicrobium sediminis]MDX1753090.1 hypothetical protein [Salinimicrobium sediminis]SOC81156.1 hypothetical protein SAMN06296241_2728 [Salinimicrobium sediminis]
MENKAHHYRYIEWKSPDEMHFSSLQWKSELNFIKDEHRFFEDMLKEYTMPIIESQLFTVVRELIQQLDHSRKDLVLLEQKVNDHSNRLQKLLEDIDTPREGRIYRDEHKILLNEVIHFSRQYKRLKKDIFEAVTKALKQQRQKRLLPKE